MQKVVSKTMRCGGKRAGRSLIRAFELCPGLYTASHARAVSHILVCISCNTTGITKQENGGWTAEHAQRCDKSGRDTRGLQNGPRGPVLEFACSRAAAVNATPD